MSVPRLGRRLVNHLSLSYGGRFAKKYAVVTLYSFSSQRSGVGVFLGDGRGGFQRAAGSPFRTRRGTWRIEVIDVNHDGKPDFITNNVESNDISILLSQ